MSRDTAGAVQGIADAVEPASLEIAYPDAVGAIINQHGFNTVAPMWKWTAVNSRQRC